MPARSSFSAYADNLLASFQDDAILRYWTESHLLAQLRQKNKGRQKQVIHDIPRPPLANVRPRDVAHRVLKDVYCKAAALMGYNVTYTPAWNLFDAAVESDVVQSEYQAGHLMDAVKVRKQCKTRVSKRMEKEKALLQRLGLFADWRGIRPHLEPRYEARLLDGFGLLMDGGFLTKEAEPSYWCIRCKTILTEDELRLRPRKSSSAHVRFPVREGLERLGVDVSLMVWVVELWALPAGIAIALPKQGQYVAVPFEGHVLIIEEGTARRALRVGTDQVLETLSTEELLQCTCSHPLLDAELPVVLSENHHCAGRSNGLFLAVPGHNQEDYSVRLEHNFKIVSIIDDEGRLTEDAERFCGLDVFAASQHIALQLDNTGFLIGTDPVETLYPHCWMCDSPAVFRPADQWLFDPKRHRLGERTARDLAAIELYPEDMAQGLAARLRTRRRWGVSRQRVWSLPVPAFYCQKCGGQLEVDRGVKAVRDLISHKGTDAWFRMKADAILSNDIACSACGEREFRKDTSILDPRMVTVLASLAQMEGRRETSAVGDIYLEQEEEGPEWVAHMLLTLSATKDHLPMQFLHVVDARPMLPPDDVLDCEAHLDLLNEPAGGADIFRLLMVAVPPGSANDGLLSLLRDEYGRLRQALLYTAYVSNGAKHLTRLPTNLPLVDALFGDHFRTEARRLAHAYRRYEFREAWRRARSLAQDLEDYARIVAADQSGDKDEKSLARSLLREWSLQFLKATTPLVPMLTEHLWQHAWNPPENGSIFLSDWPFPIEESAPLPRPFHHDARRSGTFGEWIAVARRLRGEREDASPIALIVDVPERLAFYGELAPALGVAACRPVTVIPANGASPETDGARLSDLLASLEPV
jgi:isoleucyl-tRNA synthetase